MSQQQNRLLGMIHDLIRETGLIVGDQRDDIFPGNILRGDDDKFVPGDSRPKRNVLDLAARNLAANGCAVKHVGQRHIVDVLRLSRDLVAAFFARNRHADDAIIAS